MNERDPMMNASAGSAGNGTNTLTLPLLWLLRHGMVCVTMLSLLGGIAVSGAYAATVSGAQCAVRIVRASVDWSRGYGVYNPYDASDLRGRVTVVVGVDGFSGASTPEFGDELATDLANDASTGCAGSSFASASLDSFRGPGDRINAFVVDQTKDTNLHGLSPGKQSTVEFDLVVPAGQNVSAATYSSELNVLISRKELSAERAGESLFPDRSGYSVPLRISVPDIARIEFADAGSRSRVIDFGNLGINGNKRQVVPISLRSTIGFTVAISSEYGGKLVNTTHPDSAIPYFVSLGNQNVVPSSGDSLVGIRFGGNTNVLETLVIDLDRRNDVRAGRYRDRLTISVLPDLSGS